MIISHQHKFIFFAIPKTGTHSVRFALRPLLGKEDEEQVNLFKQSRLQIAAFNNRTDGHFSVQDIQPLLSEEIWNSYFKFCFVRNPWDKFISTVFYRNRNLDRNTSQVSFMNEVLDKHHPSPSLFYSSQASFFQDANGCNAMDFIGKTETMQADFNLICDRLNLPAPELDHRNSSPHAGYQSYYNQQLKERVAQVYEKDINLFNYEF